MSKTSCIICEKEFENDRKLHSHLKAHKIRMVEYYQTHYARHDRYDGKIIKFKNKQQYFTSDFNNRGNLKKWLTKTSFLLLTQKNEEGGRLGTIFCDGRKNLEFFQKRTIFATFLDFQTFSLLF